MYSSGVEIRPSGVLLGRLSPVIDPKWWNHSGVRLYASRQEVEDEGAPAGPAGGALGGEQRCGPPCPLEKMGALDGSLVVPCGASGSQQIRWKTPTKAEFGPPKVSPAARPESESSKHFPAFWSLPGLEEDLASGAPGAGPRKDFLMNMRVSPNALPALPRLVLRWSRFSRLSHLEHPKKIKT